jgi:hypothetical protein
MIIGAWPTFLERRRIRQDWQGYVPVEGLGQSIETTGAIVAAESAESAGGKAAPSFWRSVAVGVTTAAFVWAVTRSLDRIFEIKK